MPTIETIGVIGAGTMGHSIALDFALHGFDVRLYDIAEEPLARAAAHTADALQLMVEEDFVAADQVEPILSRIRATTDLAAAVADRDYVIEAAPEQLAMKHELLRRLDGFMRPTAILASNTSSLPLAAMAQALSPARRTRFIINHWFNPGHLIPLVEFSHFGETSDEVYAEVAALYRRIGKQTIDVLKDVAGLVANRIQVALAREVFSLVERGVASPEDIDKAMKFGPAFRNATTGPVAVADFGGLDIWSAISDNILKDMDNSTKANPLLRAKAQEGNLGVKTGRGFFDYPPETIAETKRQFLRRLIHQLKASAFYV